LAAPLTSEAYPEEGILPTERFPQGHGVKQPLEATDKESTV